MTNLKMAKKNLCMSGVHTLQPWCGQIDVVLKNVLTTHDANVLSL